MNRSLSSQQSKYANRRVKAILNKSDKRINDVSYVDMSDVR